MPYIMSSGGFERILTEIHGYATHGQVSGPRRTPETPSRAPLHGAKAVFIRVSAHWRRNQIGQVVLFHGVIARCLVFTSVFTN